MTSHGDPIAQHLQNWLQAYGPDLSIPEGKAVEVTPPPAPVESGPGESGLGESAPEPAEPVAAEPAAAPPPPMRPTEPEPATAPPPVDDTVDALKRLRDIVLPCTKCKLHERRITTVFGEGNPHARVMFVGEAPGAKEDQTGRPFVGPAGQLLDRILKGAMGLERKDVFIANINKCRPPGNRNPEPDEVAACLPYLREQVAIIQPEVIVCLGRVAAQNLLSSTASTRMLRGKTHEYADIPVIVTWHPAYLLRDPSHKRETWDDIKKVNQLLGLPETPDQKG